MPEAAPLPPAPTRRPAAANPGSSTRLRAVTRRVPRRPAHPSSGGEAEGDENGAGSSLDEGAPEPNMRLSRAVLVMLLLHVVAVGGVLAFGMIKESPPAAGTTGGRASKPTSARNGPRADPPGAAAADHAPTPFPAPVANKAPTAPVPSTPPPVGRTTPAASTPALSRVEADAVRLIESGGPHPVGVGERAYLVGRGETVQAIAQKLRVEPSALLRLNGIDDPRKIHVGQRLRVPPPPSSTAPTGRTRS